MDNEDLWIQCPFCETHQTDDWIYEMEEDDEEEGCCDICNESYLVYRSDETNFDVYKLI